MTRILPSLAAALACMCATSGQAQDASAGGMLLTFGIDQRFQATSDSNLTDTDITAERTSNTNLSFGFSSETRTERLDADMRTGLRINSDGAEITDPRYSLAYTRTGATAAFEISASQSQSDITYLRDLFEFTDADGVITLPDDVDDLSGSGTRIQRNLGTSLRWGENEPTGYRVSISQAQLRYRDASASLVDTTTTRVGAGLRLTLSPVVTTNLDLRYTAFDAAGSPREDTTALDVGVTLARPRGDITTGFSVTQTDDGDLRWGLSLGQSLTGPRSTLNARIGLTQDSAGAAQLTGRLRYRYTLPQGQISLSAQQGFTTGGSADGRNTTTLQASYAHSLSPLSNLSVGFDYAQIRDEDGSDQATGRLNASYGLTLTPDWQMQFGASTNLRDETSAGRTSARSVFVALNRSFSVRP